MKNKSLKNKINTFCDYFTCQIEIIDSLICSGSTEPNMNGNDDLFLHKQTLLVSLLDCLSNIRFHKKVYKQLAKQNRIRFIRFLQEYSGWNCGNLISLPFLRHFLPTSVSANPLARFLNDEITKASKYLHDVGDSISTSSLDKDAATLKQLAVMEVEEDAIDYCQHYSILYRYRNYLVHEARNPGDAMKCMELRGEASYHTYINDDRLFLLYPVSLLKNIVNNSLGALRRYLCEMEIDPYLRVDDTSRF